MPATETSQLPRFKLSAWFWSGVALLAVGTAPLVLIMLFAWLGLTSDPNPNPVGPSILAFFTFWPSLILIAVGLSVSIVRDRKAKRI